MCMNHDTTTIENTYNVNLIAILHINGNIIDEVYHAYDKLHQILVVNKQNVKGQSLL